ncbi:helix-turn-helix transcriptional regulator [Methylobacterium oxalidis]|uniref:helix-turn-helix transcriptional regulator n=1 Tax=Methylobacterium oxalidis TaxID=944322 RepID=UPI003315B44E
MTQHDKTEYRRRFSARFKRLRIAANLTHQEVAHRVGVSVQTTSQWEAGRTLPTARKRGRLALVLGASLDDAEIADEALDGEEQAVPQIDLAVTDQPTEDRHHRLKQARELAGFSSAAEAANHLKVPYGTYSGHEAGSRGIRHRDLLRYATAFGVDVAWLQFGQDDPCDELVSFNGNNDPKNLRTTLLERFLDERFGLQLKIELLTKLLSRTHAEMDVLNDAISQLQQQTEARGAE